MHVYVQDTELMSATQIAIYTKYSMIVSEELYCTLYIESNTLRLSQLSRLLSGNDR